MGPRRGTTAPLIREWPFPPQNNGPSEELSRGSSGWTDGRMEGGGEDGRQQFSRG